MSQNNSRNSSPSKVANLVYRESNKFKSEENKLNIDLNNLKIEKNRISEINKNKIDKGDLIDLDLEGIIDSKDKLNLEEQKTQSSPNVQHTSLSFDRKPKNKMSNEIILKLEEAIKLIQKATGEDDIYRFVQACDIAIESIEKKNVQILIKYITTRLSGRALESIKYKDNSK